MSHTHTHTLGTWQHWATLELHWQYRLMAYVQSKHLTFDQDLISLVQCVHFGIMWLLDWAIGKVLKHITTPCLTKRDHRLLNNDMNEQKWNEFLLNLTNTKVKQRYAWINCLDSLFIRSKKRWSCGSKSENTACWLSHVRLLSFSMWLWHMKLLEG